MDPRLLDAPLHVAQMLYVTISKHGDVHSLPAGKKSKNKAERITRVSEVRGQL